MLFDISKVCATESYNESRSFSWFLGFVCVFGLLPDRKKSTYRFFLTELRNIAKDMNMNFNPTSIVTDFECALMEVLATEVHTVFFLI